jgi:hypothetical protein
MGVEAAAKAGHCWARGTQLPQPLSVRRPVPCLLAACAAICQHPPTLSERMFSAPPPPPTGGLFDRAVVHAFRALSSEALHRGHRRSVRTPSHLGGGGGDGASQVVALRCSALHVMADGGLLDLGCPSALASAAAGSPGGPAMNSAARAITSGRRLSGPPLAGALSERLLRGPGDTHPLLARVRAAAAAASASVGGGESCMHVHWVAVPKTLRARRVNSQRGANVGAHAQRRASPAGWLADALPAAAGGAGRGGSALAAPPGALPHGVDPARSPREWARHTSTAAAQQQRADRGGPKLPVGGAGSVLGGGASTSQDIHSLTSVLIAAPLPRCPSISVRSPLCSSTAAAGPGRTPPPSASWWCSRPCPRPISPPRGGR